MGGVEGMPHPKDHANRVREVVMFIERNKVVIAFLIGMALGLVFGAWFGVILDLVACWSEVP